MRLIRPPLLHLLVVWGSQWATTSMNCCLLLVQHTICNTVLSFIKLLGSTSLVALIFRLISQMNLYAGPGMLSGQPMKHYLDNKKGVEDIKREWAKDMTPLSTSGWECATQPPQRLQGQSDVPITRNWSVCHLLSINYSSRSCNSTAVTLYCLQSLFNATSTHTDINLVPSNQQPGNSPASICFSIVLP